MSNHTGTLFRIIFIFLALFGFWFFVSLIFSGVIVLLTTIEFNISTLLYTFVLLLAIRTFYPRFIFIE